LHNKAIPNVCVGAETLSNKGLQAMPSNQRSCLAPTFGRARNLALDT